MKLKFKFSKKNIALLSIALGALFFAGSYTVSYFIIEKKYMKQMQRLRMKNNQ